MKTSGAAILMMKLSLAAAALLAADAVVTDVGIDIILLPSDGAEAGLVAGQVMEMSATDAVEEKEDEPPAREEERPWACCNQTLCTKSIPPTCRCLDVVDRCAAACRQCEPSGENPSRHVCNDQYHGDPGPTCSKDDDDDVPSGAYGRSSPSVAAAAAQLLLACVAMVFIQNR